MILKPGHCSRCEKPAWRTAQHAKTEQTFILWPDTLSRYASYKVSGGIAPGITFCRECPPEREMDLVPSEMSPLVEIIPAPVRYGAWFQAPFGIWLRAWLVDHLELTEDAAQPILAQWAADVAAVKDLYGAQQPAV